MLESIKEFCYLLDVEPFWIAILMFTLVIKTLIPWRLEYKVEETEDEKTGKKIYRIFRLDDK